jgi:glycerophosphoryl diester phosphodiesterase
VQSGNLKTLKTQTNLPLVQLLSSSPAIVDEPGSTLESAGSGEGLAKIAKYASGVGPSKDAILPPTEDGYAGASTGLVQRVHDAGMQVCAFMFFISGARCNACIL